MINQQVQTGKKFSKNKIYINPNNENKLFLKTSSFKRNGWFLFGIKHKGNNNKCFGIFKCGQFGYKQSRPMYPIRRRWRVVRIKKNTSLYLTLNNISEPIFLMRFGLSLYYLLMPLEELLIDVKRLMNILK